MVTVEKGVGWWVERVIGSRVVPFMHMHAPTSPSTSRDALEARWSGGAMVGMLGTTVPSSPLWVMGRRLFHRCFWRSCLLALLCGHNVPTSGEREHSRLSPVGLFLFLFRVVSVLLRSLPTWLRGVWLVGGEVESRCVRCVVHLLLLLQVSQWRCRVVCRVTTVVHLLVLGVVRALRRWQGPVP